jgi:hypothetical protein
MERVLELVERGRDDDPDGLIALDVPEARSELVGGGGPGPGGGRSARAASARARRARRCPQWTASPRSAPASAGMPRSTKAWKDANARPSDPAPSRAQSSVCVLSSA